MKIIKNKNIIIDIKGATAIEYSLIAAFIAIGLILSLTSIGSELNEIFAAVNTAFTPTP